MGLKAFFTKEYVIAEKGFTSEVRSLGELLIFNVIFSIAVLVLSYSVFFVEYHPSDLRVLGFAMMLGFSCLTLLFTIPMFIKKHSKLKELHPLKTFKDLLKEGDEIKTYFIKMTYKEDVIKQIVELKRYDEVVVGEIVPMIDFPVEKFVTLKLSTSAKALIITALTLIFFSLQGYYMFETIIILLIGFSMFAGNQESSKDVFSFICGCAMPLVFMFFHIKQMVDASMSGNVLEILLVIVSLIVVFSIHYIWVYNSLLKDPPLPVNNVNPEE